MKKPKYYVYYSYKDDLYHLFSRDTFKDVCFYSFEKLFDYINDNNIKYENCRLKSMTLKEFFEYACFGGGRR